MLRVVDHGALRKSPWGTAVHNLGTAAINDIILLPIRLNNYRLNEIISWISEMSSKIAGVYTLTLFNYKFNNLNLNTNK